MNFCSPNIDETKHWRKLLNGDQQALAFFYEQYADHLLRYGLSITYNREIVQDAVQELFINIWNRRQNLSVPDSVKYYLMVSLRRIILKDLLHARQSTDVFSDDALSFADHESLFAEEYREDVHLKLQHAVRLLPARQQEIIFLRFFQKLSYEQITAITGLDYQILRNTIYRAIKTLRNSLTEKVVLTLLALAFQLFH